MIEGEEESVGELDSYGTKRKHEERESEAELSIESPERKTTDTSEKRVKGDECRRYGFLQLFVPISSGKTVDNRCGGHGHLSSQCTSPKGSNELCHNCGGNAHVAVYCPSPKGANQSCHNCGGKGHVKRKCPNLVDIASLARESCYLCGALSHFARDCPTMRTRSMFHGMSSQGPPMQSSYQMGPYGMGPMGQNSYGGGPYGQPTHKLACYTCGGEGHMSRDCPAKPGRSLGAAPAPGGLGGFPCYTCGEVGHISRNCPKTKAMASCYRCGQQGHMVRECPQAPLIAP